MKDKSINYSKYYKMGKVSMSKKENSQDEMEKVLVVKIIDCIKSISEQQEEEGIPSSGLTVYVAEVGIDGKEYDMTLCLTPKGVFSDFQKKTKKPFTFM